jgi:hypothetical protein
MSFDETMSINDAVETRLSRYLETEALLNDFFSVFDYCLSRCIALEREKNGQRPVPACCTGAYYARYDLDHPAFVRLRQERERRYGRPEDYHWTDQVSPCPYHDPNRGCVLKTHKSPICIAFLCHPAIDCLREDYGIYQYDCLGIYYALEWILTGELPERQYLELVESIRGMIGRCRERQGRSASGDHILQSA